MADTQATESACGLCENPVQAAVLLGLLVVLLGVEVVIVWMLL